jgi:hypothetical protein
MPWMIFLSGGQKVAKAPSTSAAVIADAVPMRGGGTPMLSHLKSLNIN